MASRAMGGELPYSPTPDQTTYLTQEQAVAVDQELMGPLGFSIDQLMELAGLSVACSVAAERPPPAHVLVLAGPGNNGGDGLVAARHLCHFGYSVKICYPKATDKPLYHGLVTQCQSLGVPFVPVEDVVALPRLADAHDVIIDALFGFSFRGAPRAPFDALLDAVAARARGTLVASIDIPSGWHVERGDEGGCGLRPDMLISLTAPKLAARFFQGPHHYLGGRFVPPAIRDRFELVLPSYPGTAMYVKLQGGKAVADMRLEEATLEGALADEDLAADPVNQFDKWFEEAAQHAGSQEPNAMALATASASGAPSVRMVLLKAYDTRGFVFYTNSESRKASELQANPRAALSLFWERLNRAVRIEGSVERVADGEAEAYFRSRPRGSQLGAWCSAQSAVVASRQDLEDELALVEARFEDPAVAVPKPPFWGGYRVVPHIIEFWQSRPSRLHDRLRYSKDSTGSWKVERLSP